MHRAAVLPGARRAAQAGCLGLWALCLAALCSPLADAAEAEGTVDTDEPLSERGGGGSLSGADSPGFAGALSPSFRAEGQLHTSRSCILRKHFVLATSHRVCVERPFEDGAFEGSSLQRWLPLLIGLAAVGVILAVACLCSAGLRRCAPNPRKV
jgi:hypothetical protein